MNNELKEYQELCELVREAQEAYHGQDHLIMADYDYDQKIKELRAIEAAHPEWRTEDSPTEAVGAAIKRGLYPVTHDIRMLSLDNAFNDTELLEHMNRWGNPQAGMTASPKFDGLAVKLDYTEGRLTEAATRGDSRVGESIIHNLRGNPTIPEFLIKAPQRIQITGEIMIDRKDFAEINELLIAQGKLPMANPRNAAAGIARRINGKGEGLQKYLRFKPYGIALVSPDFQSHSHSQTMQQLDQWGFNVILWASSEISFEWATKMVVILDEARKSLDYDIDGVVFRVDEYTACNNLGTTSRAPKWGVARKLPPEEKSTVVQDIRIQIGRTGNATPVAVLDEVNVGGVNVTNATLHNEDFINALDLAVGDTVVVRRAGDVIPEIAAVTHRGEDRTPWTFPTECPECSSPLVRKDGTANHYCTGGAKCPAQIQRRFEHFVSRDAMDIDGLGEEIISDLLKEGLIMDPSDLFRLTKDQLLSIRSENSGRWAWNVIEAIEQAKRTTLARVLISAGIPLVGQSTARDLAEYFGSLELITRASVELLKTVPGIGKEVAQSIFDYFHDEAGVLGDNPIQRLLDAGVEIIDELGPSPAFAELANFPHLFSVYGIKRVRAPKGKGLERTLELLDRLGYPGHRAVKLRQKDPEYTEATEYYEANATALWALQRDWDLIKAHAGKVRAVTNNSPLAGNTYVLTGGFEETLGSRQALTQQLIDLGAKVTSSVSAKTTAVFAGTAPGENKLEAARKHSVPILTQNDLQEVLSKHSKSESND